MEQLVLEKLADLNNLKFIKNLEFAKKINEIKLLLISKTTNKNFLFAGLITLFGLVIRLINISNPTSYIFDETYYIKDAKHIITSGAEEGFFVHPELGKILIGLPMRIGGLDNTFCWRLSAVIFGTVCIALTIVAAKKMLNSWVFANFAGFLMCIDGVEIVLSRVSLLDIFVTTFVLSAFIFLLYNKPIGLGIFSGLAMSVKWSALWFIIVFVIYYFLVNRQTIFQHFNANKLINLKKNIIQKNFLRPLGQLSILPILIYIFNWLPYLIYRPELQNKSIFQRLYILMDFHKQIYNFHANLTSTHSYQSAAWQWIPMARPTAMYYNGAYSNGRVCEIISLGNLFIWWGGGIALFFLIFSWLNRNLRTKIELKKIGLLLFSVAAGILPWLILYKRITFQFYAIIILPFIVICLTNVLHYLLSTNIISKRKIISYLTIIAIISLTISIYFYPVWSGLPITYDHWKNIMFFQNWI
ncbi:MAG: phospholipid carrier-dependent glycosyltransferase [Bifidobacteriaceae bacterium]|jgi:dolichyl-phosphate-mannose--protein O-mannosyl transferase|nr:phospholipid carrier-dependent glycosyltransferase [Bifidobacteriaceae bacterium]